MERGHIKASWRWGSLILAGVCFWLAVSELPAGKTQVLASDNELVLPPAMQLVLNLGDPYLAANLEAVRVMTSDRLADGESLGFYVRLHRSISQLNPCHEDAFYMAAAFLASGGAGKPALEILNRGKRCRYWDAWAAFHLGINYFFFVHDSGAAAMAVNDAVERAANAKERVFFKGVAVKFKARDFDDLTTAIRYLQVEYGLARDEGLKQALYKRIGRLQGLVMLREAQRRFSGRFGRAPQEPSELLRSGILKSLPVDPLGIGYQFENGRFEMKEIDGRQGAGNETIN